MLEALTHTRQIPGEKLRIWYTSIEMDLIVWFAEAGAPIEFELCYDKGSYEKSLRYSNSGVVHSALDSGENKSGKHKLTPVLRESTKCNVDRLYRLFIAEAKQLPDEIKNFVIVGLERYTSTQQ